MKDIFSKTVYFLIVIVALLGVINSPSALLLGFIYTIIFNNPFIAFASFKKDGSEYSFVGSFVSKSKDFAGDITIFISIFLL